MNPLQAEIYNIIYEAGQHGLRLNEIYVASRLALDKTEAVQAVHELRAEGKVIWISKDGQKRYLAGTAQHVAAIKAHVEKKREASKAPPLKEGATRGNVKAAAGSQQRPSQRPPPPSPPPARDIQGRKGAEKQQPEPSAIKGLVESATWQNDCMVFSVKVFRKNLADVNLVGHEIQLVKGARP